MSLKLKSFYKRIAAFLLSLICLLAPGFPLTAYAAVDAASITLRVDQIFKNNSAFTNVNSVIHYELLSMEAGNPLPSGGSGSLYSFTIDGTASFDIGPIAFTDTGIYRYEIRVDSSHFAPGYTYDKRVYSARVNVRKSGLDMVADIMVGNNSGSKSSNIKFNHSYTSSGSKPVAMADPPVEKTVLGNPSLTSSFVFLLTAGHPSNPMPAGSINGKKTIKINGSGQKSFGTWEYIREGTYYYNVSEVDTDEAGYTYDQAIYTITDVVKDANGQLTVARTLTNKYNKLVESFLFINKYNGNDSGNEGEGVYIPGNTIGPKTGDDAGIELYIMVMITAGITAVGCILYLVFIGRRRREARKCLKGTNR